MLNSKAKQKPKKSRQEINEESRELKKKRKHKGLPSGSRFNNIDGNQNKKSSKVEKDSRIGSKKPISLIIEASDNTSNTPKKPKPNKLLLSPEQELEQIEKDPRLEQLLDLVEQNIKLTNDQQSYLDTKLNRIDELMQKLGYTDEDFDNLDEKPEDIMSLLKRH